MNNDIKITLEKMNKIKKEIKEKQLQIKKLEEEIELYYTKIKWFEEDIENMIKDCFRHVDKIIISENNIEIQVHTFVGIKVDEIIQISNKMNKKYDDVKLSTKGNYICLNIKR